MKYYLVYLALIALIATALIGTVAAAAGDVTCTLGSYGKIAAQQEGRC